MAFTTHPSRRPCRGPVREHPAAPQTPLPTGRDTGHPLPALPTDRVSCRDFSLDALPLSALATRLHVAYGVLGHTVDDGVDMLDHPVPSAGGLYPHEVSVLGACRRRCATTCRSPRARAAARPHAARWMLACLFMGPPWEADAAAVLVLSAAMARSLGKYGDRGCRCVLLEAGQVGQNVALIAAALGFGSLAVGGFHDEPPG